MPDVPNPPAKTLNDPGVDMVAPLIFEALNRASQRIGVFDTGLRLTLFNDAFVEYLDLSAGAVHAGMPLESLTRANTASTVTVLEELKTLVEGCAGGAGGVETRSEGCLESTLADGRIIETRCHALPGGGIVTTHSDVTGRRRAETRLEDAVQSLAEGFMLWDAEDRLVTFNEKIREFYPGMDDILVAGRRFEDNFRENVRRGIIVVPAGVDPEDWIHERIEQHRNPTGPISRRTVTGQWLRIVERRTAEGGVVGVVVDVTDLKRIQETLSERERRLKMAVSGTKDGLWDRDLLRDRTWYSPVWQEIIGFTAHSDAKRPLFPIQSGH